MKNLESWAFNCSSKQGLRFWNHEESAAAVLLRCGTGGTVPIKVLGSPCKSVVQNCCSGGWGRNSETPLLMVVSLSELCDAAWQYCFTLYTHTI